MARTTGGSRGVARFELAFGATAVSGCTQGPAITVLFKVTLLIAPGRRARRPETVAFYYEFAFSRAPSNKSALLLNADTTTADC